MSEEKPGVRSDESPEDTSQNSPPAGSYPARDADNGEEQRNRLGYMVTEPTEEEIEEAEKTQPAGDS